MAEKTKRNAAIYREYVAGKSSAAAIGRKYGISGGMVSIIANRLIRRKQAAERAKGATPDGPIDAYELGYDLGVRAVNCLKNENITTLRQLEEYTEYELLRVPNFGRKSLNDIVALCKREGVQLGSRSHERWQRRVQEQDNRTIMKAHDDDATEARINAAVERYTVRQRERLGAPTCAERMALVYARIQAADLMTRFVKGDPEAVMQVCETV